MIDQNEIFLNRNNSKVKTSIFKRICRNIKMFLNVLSFISGTCILVEGIILNGVVSDQIRISLISLGSIVVTSSALMISYKLITRLCQKLCHRNDISRINTEIPSAIDPPAIELQPLAPFNNMARELPLANDRKSEYSQSDLSLNIGFNYGNSPVVSPKIDITIEKTHDRTK